MEISEVIYLGELRCDATHLKSATTIQTDAPIDNNGKGERFSPTDLTATSLASCMLTIMGIEAVKNNALFFGAKARVQKLMAINPRRIAIIRVAIALPKALEQNHKLWEEVSRTCPVALSLHPDIKQEISFNYY